MNASGRFRKAKTRLRELFVRTPLGKRIAEKNKLEDKLASWTAHDLKSPLNALLGGSSLLLDLKPIDGLAEFERGVKNLGFFITGTKENPLLLQSSGKLRRKMEIARSKLMALKKQFSEIKLRYANDEQVSSIVDGMEAEIFFAERLFDDFLNRGKSSFKTSVIQLDKFTKEIVQASSGSASKTRAPKVIVDIPQGMNVRMNRLDLERAIRNIANNSFEHNPKSTFIVKGIVSAEGRSNELQFISRNGKKIPEEIIRDFPNHRSSTGEKGRGLGLSMTYVSMRKNRHNFEIQNTPDGPKFTIKLGQLA